MAQLRLPEVIIGALPSLAELTDEQFESLAKAVEAAPPLLYHIDVVDYLEEKLAGQPGAAHDIPHAIASLYDGRDQAGDSADGFASAVAESAASRSEQLRNVRSVIQQRLTRLLNVQNLLAASHARNVLFEQERIFTEARILTDVRPVFSKETDLEGAVVVHSLRVEYRENRQAKTIFFALDNRDLASLLEVVKRAQEKDAKLKALIRSTKIPMFEESQVTHVATRSTTTSDQI